MAELQCSSYGQERNCLDTSKMIAFKEVSQDYFSVFGYSNISVVEIYPLANGKPMISEKILEYLKKNPKM